jgi:hypothetical protein
MNVVTPGPVSRIGTSAQAIFSVKICNPIRMRPRRRKYRLIRPSGHPSRRLDSAKKTMLRPRRKKNPGAQGWVTNLVRKARELEYWGRGIPHQSDWCTLAMK